MNTDTPSERRPRPRVARGPARPQYLQPLDNDRLVMMLTALAAEVSALRDRLATHEALAAKGMAATPAAIEAHTIDADDAARREAERSAMLRRVFRVVSEDLDALPLGPSRRWASPEDWDGHA